MFIVFNNVVCHIKISLLQHFSLFVKIFSPNLKIFFSKTSICRVCELLFKLQLTAFTALKTACIWPSQSLTRTCRSEIVKVKEVVNIVDIISYSEENAYLKFWEPRWISTNQFIISLIVLKPIFRLTKNLSLFQQKQGCDFSCLHRIHKRFHPKTRS